MQQFAALYDDMLENSNTNQKSIWNKNYAWIFVMILCGRIEPRDFCPDLANIDISILFWLLRDHDNFFFFGRADILLIV